ncbi:SpoIIE family protein phosphatase [Nocardioides sp. SOB44]|uniref:SpoIIE family protein phosphatase n=1 Tax=Nocardioides cremeus TaxID=3058044 RepID=A0ABT8TMF0_9ACTN|nr:SpoIIE family protein phosphatase [Nocardioides cremeus]MDO3395139.1 SpoIIE family protein phosphatase [Nocardioides cremeus]
MTQTVDQSRTRRARTAASLGLLEAERNARVDRITALAARVFGVEMTTVTVLDGDRATFPLSHGLDPGTTMPRSEVFCDLTQRQGEPMYVEDASLDPRFASWPIVTDAGIRFYAGHPLRDHMGTVVATLCLLDSTPRRLGDDEKELLAELAGLAETEMVSSTEMRLAQEAQASLLPQAGLEVDGWRIEGACVPAAAVGGDFYDYRATGRSAVLRLADVMGKGTPAALVAAGVRAALRGTEAAAAGVDLGVTVTRTARTLADDMERTESFVTLFEAVIDLDDGEVRYVDAGCGLALVARNDGSVEPLRSNDGPIGLWAEDHWTEHRTRLEPGERLVVVSDGVLDLVGEGPGHADRIAELVLGRDAVSRLEEIVRGCETTSAVDDVTVVVATRPASEGAR